MAAAAPLDALERVAAQVITRGILNFPDGTSERVRTRKDFVWLQEKLMRSARPRRVCDACAARESELARAQQRLPGHGHPEPPEAVPPEQGGVPRPVQGGGHPRGAHARESGAGARDARDARARESRSRPEYRRARAQAGFEKYLTKIAAHETLSTNDSFKLFLQQEEEVFAETLADTAEPPVEKVKQALSWVDVRVALAWKLLTEKKLLGYEEGEEAPQEEPSPCDAMMMAPEQYIMEVDGKLTALKNAITYMVSKSKDANDKLAEFSDAAHELGEFEDSADLKNLSSATESLTVCTKDYFDKVEANFIGPLDELVEELSCVKRAMMDQKTARHKWAAARKSLQKKTIGHEELAKKLENAPKGDKTPEETICDTRSLPPACANVIAPVVDDEAVSNAEAAITDATADLELCETNLEKVTLCVLKEIDKFKATKSGEVGKMIKAYAKVQVDMCDKQKQEWLKV